MEHLQDQKCDVCFVQETFLKDYDTAKLQEIRDYGWNVLSNPRKHRSGGGIAILYRNDIKLTSNTKVTKYKTYQVMEAVLSSKSGLIRLVNIYRPPYSQKARHTESMFLEEFENYLGDLSKKPGSPVIAGDFNIHVEKPNELYPRKFLNLLGQYGLVQCVPLVPTHEQGGTLDLVIVNEELSRKTNSFNVIDSGVSSDHYLVNFEISVELELSKGTKPKRISYRNFNTIIIDAFKSDIIGSNLGDQETWESYDMNAAVEQYQTVLTELMDKHCPVIEKTIKENYKPWIDKDLRCLRRKRRAAERAWRQGKGEKKTYTNLRNQFTSVEEQKRRAYNRKALLASSGDTKTLYKKLNRLLGKTSQDLPNHSDPRSLAEDFKEFFSDKVNNIRSEIVEESKSLNVDNNSKEEEEEENKEEATGNCKLDSFSPITLDEIMKYIAKMSNKFCGLDPIPSFLLKKCVEELSPVLLHIVNLSLDTAEFPADMKNAVIKPTLKKEDADTDCLSNYRPVSNLPAISKLLERVVLDQLNNYLAENSLHCPVQSGYRPQHSCETLLVRMTEDIFKEIQSDNIVILVLLDLSAAFDTIDHGILLDKLLKDFGIRDKALKWFKSYLQNRAFCVKVDKALSDFLCLMFGVPQGSLLGPILFILYIKYLQKIAAKYGLSIQLYADDSQLYISFHPTRPSELDDVTDKINSCLAEIKDWMIRNFMKLNESKTELLIIGKPMVLQKFNLNIELQFGSTEIKPTECKGDNWKSLGVKLDASLNMERQINSVRQKCYWTLNNIRGIQRYLDEALKLMLVKQLIISKMDFCNSLYMNLPKTRLKKLKSILNGCVRFIYNVSVRSEDLIPYYKKAHILPVDERIFFKVCLLSYKVVYGISPDYLQDLVEMDYPSDHDKGTRARPVIDDYLRMKLPKMERLKASNRRFSNYAPEAWNSLPREIRSITDVSNFKKMLKNYLFDRMGIPKL